MAIDRANINNTEESLNEKFITTSTFKRDREGRYFKGDLPRHYFEQTPSFYNKDAHTTNYDKTDLKITFRTIQIINRVGRELKSDDEYELKDYLAELDRENAIMEIANQNKEGPYNNRRLMITNVTESTNKSIEALEQVKAKLGGIFTRK